MKPVEIVGGGLAGLALGIALRRAGAAVTVFEAGDYPRHRACGEFIRGLDTATMARLGLTDFFGQLEGKRRVTWHGRGDVRRCWQLPQPAFTISRHRLDAELAEKFVGAGGTLVTSRRLSASDTPEGRVFATGKSSGTDSPWLGLKLHFTGLTLESDLEFYPATDAYVGLCPVEDGRVNVCGLFRRRIGMAADRGSILQGYLRASRLDGLADRLAAAVPCSESFCAVAGLRFGRQPGSHSRAAIGDAFAVIPPFTGHGMAMAFQSAVCALDPLLAWSRGRTSWEATVDSIQQRQERLFRGRLRNAASIHPFVRTRTGTRVADLMNRWGLVPMSLLTRLVSTS